MTQASLFFSLCNEKRFFQLLQAALFNNCSFLPFLLQLDFGNKIIQILQDILDMKEQDNLSQKKKKVYAFFSRSSVNIVCPRRMVVIHHRSHIPQRPRDKPASQKVISLQTDWGRRRNDKIQNFWMTFTHQEGKFKFRMQDINKREKWALKSLNTRTSHKQCRGVRRRMASLQKTANNSCSSSLWGRTHIQPWRSAELAAHHIKQPFTLLIFFSQ